MSQSALPLYQIENHREQVLEELEQIIPYDETEEEHQMFILNFVGSNKDFCSRNNRTGHLTASAWITDKDHTKVLMIHHRKLDRWLQPGGHIEAEDVSLYEAALREALEETGVTDIRPADEEFKEIFDVDVHIIPERGDEPSHHHLDIRYHFYADPNKRLEANSEVKEIQWVPVSKLVKNPPEDSVFRMVEKLLDF